jgi:hypothetical protein
MRNPMLMKPTGQYELYIHRQSGNKMRPGQKNRMRGGRNSGNNNNRRGPNPLTRSYESNGPDVKVRGTPQHIAEKYMQLARDANSAGDNVMAEAYLQHAEHYYRIIAAAQNAQQVAYNQANGIANPADAEAEDEDEFEVAGSDRFTFRTPQSFQAPTGQNGAPQPFSEGGEQPAMTDGQPSEGGQPSYQQPREQQREQQPREHQPREHQPREHREHQPREHRGDRQDRQFGNRRPYEDRGDRSERGERPQYDRQPQDRVQGERPQGDRPQGERPQYDRPDRNNRRFGRDRHSGDRSFADRPGYVPRDNRDAPAGDVSQDQPAMEQPQAGLPSFITAPVRPVMNEQASAPAPEVSGEAAAPQRRRRRTRLEMAADAAAAAADESN